MKKQLYLLMTMLIALLLNFKCKAQVEHIIDFNNYPQANLHGVDNWTTIAHTSGTGDFDVAFSGGELIAPDESIAVFYNYGGPNVGRTATRKASENFNFNFQDGGIIDLELDMYRLWWGAFFGVGYDGDGDGNVTPGLVDSDGGIYLSCAEHNGETAINLPNGDKININSYTHEGWTRFKMSFDFSAYNGKGSVTVSVKPNCEGEWIQLSEATAINMQLTPGSGNMNDYKMWNGIFFHSQGHTGAFDNLIVRQMPEGNMQYISMEDIPNQTTNSNPITLIATATSGLDVEFELISGPANLNENIITLNGTPGEVIVKAKQLGNENWLPAPEVFKNFNVYDPNMFEPEVTIRRPYDNTTVYMPEMKAILLVVSAYIEHNDVLEIEKVICNIDGQILEAETFFPDDPNNGYYSCLWTPPAPGNYNMIVEVISTGGKTTTLTNSFIVTDQVENIDLITMQGELVCNPSNHNAFADYVFPCHVGAFNSINAYYQHNCINGNCDTYDRVGGVKIKNYKGEWIELFRYISPFGVECEDNIDVSDFTTQLQGLVEFEYYFETWNGDGYNPTLTFNYNAGSPDYDYINIEPVWDGIFDFGNYANLQPVPSKELSFNKEVMAATVKMITTGHNWSSNTYPDYSVNTGNAAEFYEATHQLTIDGQPKYSQHLWPNNGSCSPNPAGCQPQAGTWTYPRAGWCPGAMAMVWDWNITEYINNNKIIIGYQLDENYIDYCHPNHPDCISGQSGCPNCKAPNNPILKMTANILTYSNNENLIALKIKDNIINNNSNIVQFYPNPVKDRLTFKTNNNEEVKVVISDLAQRQILNFSFYKYINISISDLQAGTYIVTIISKEKIQTKKLIVY